MKTQLMAVCAALAVMTAGISAHADTAQETTTQDTTSKSTAQSKTGGGSAVSGPETKMESNVQNMVSSLKGACKSDLDKYCKDVTPGEGRIAACLDSKEDQLSTVCKSAWTGTKARVSHRLDKAEVAFRKSCSTDVQKFCADVPSGRGRLLECLSGHKSDLSASCQKFHASLDQRLADIIG